MSFILRLKPEFDKNILFLTTTLLQRTYRQPHSQKMHQEWKRG